VPADVLEERGVENWSTLPLWISDPGFAGLQQVDFSRARAAGLASRSVEDTVNDTLAWIRSGDDLFVDQGRARPGVDPALERELVEA
jgi:2'-hydroxyisoflavone reductase